VLRLAQSIQRWREAQKITFWKVLTAARIILPSPIEEAVERRGNRAIRKWRERSTVSDDARDIQEQTGCTIEAAILLHEMNRELAHHEDDETLRFRLALFRKET